jgi:hypothetical protein
MNTAPMPADYVNVGDLRAELSLSSDGISHRDFLTKFNVVAAYAKPWARGYIHYITVDDADNIRRRVARDKARKEKEAQKAPPLDKSAPEKASNVVPFRTSHEDALGAILGQLSVLNAQVSEIRTDLDLLMKALGEKQ